MLCRRNSEVHQSRQRSKPRWSFRAVSDALFAIQSNTYAHCATQCILVAIEQQHVHGNAAGSRGISQRYGGGCGSDWQRSGWFSAAGSSPFVPVICRVELGFIRNVLSSLRGPEDAWMEVRSLRDLL